MYLEAGAGFCYGAAHTPADSYHAAGRLAADRLLDQRAKCHGLKRRGNAMTEESSGNERANDELRRFDTGKWSPLHALFTRPPGEDAGFCRTNVCPFLVAAAAFYLIPLIVAVVEFTVSGHPPLWEVAEPAKVPLVRDSSEILNELRTVPDRAEVPLLRDWSTMFNYLVVVPLFLVLLLTERALIPARLALLHERGVLKIGEAEARDFSKSWERRYRWTNLAALLVGAVFTAVAVLWNHAILVDERYAGWQGTGGTLSWAGWVFLLWQLPALYGLIGIYLTRAVAVAWCLHALVSQSEERIAIDLFHPDNCGGLRPVGWIGLRNQWLLIAGGIGVAIWVPIAEVANAEGDFASVVAVVAVIYLVGGPLLFVSPLLPFRGAMLRTREREAEFLAKRLRTEYERIKSHLADEGVSEEDDEAVARLQKFGKLIRGFPVWPFDTLTLRTFLTAYAAPILVALATAALTKALW
jgi:hypothetical protein